MSQRVIQFNKENIHYQIIGNGYPVMFIHGFAEDSSIWDDIAQALSTNYKIILPNVPGSGNTALLQLQTNDIDNYADAMFAILQAEKHNNAVVIGHSMGGYIALSMAHKQPSLIKALGLFHSTAYADDETKKENRAKSIAFIKENGAAAFLKTSVPGLFAHPTQHENAIKTLIKKGEQFKKDTLVQYYEAMMTRPDSTHVLAKAGFPILFVMGLKDMAVPFSLSLQQSHIPAIGHISILRNSAHMGMIEEPEKSLLILKDFLQAIYV